MVLVGPLMALPASAQSEEVVFWYDKPIITKKLDSKKDWRVFRQMRKPTTADKQKMMTFLDSNGFDLATVNIHCTEHSFPGSRQLRSNTVAKQNADLVSSRGLNLMNYVAKENGINKYDNNWTLKFVEHDLPSKKSWFSCVLRPIP
jgi:hypothetical protein